MLSGRHPTKDLDLGRPKPDRLWDVWHQERQELLTGSSSQGLTALLELPELVSQLVSRSRGKVSTGAPFAELG